MQSSFRSSYRTWLFLIPLLAMPTVASAQGPRGGPRGGTPPEVKLTGDSVQRMLKAVPEFLKATASHRQQMLSGMASGRGATEESPEELAKRDAVLKKYGFTLQEFMMQFMALAATHFIMSPGAFERQVPSEDKPEVQALLNDPRMTEEDKKMVRSQIAFAQQNKSIMRAQYEQIATPNNRKAVKPYLPQVQQMFAAIEAKGRKAFKEATSKKGARPRRSP